MGLASCHPSDVFIDFTKISAPVTYGNILGEYAITP
jgi:hypothetical protein